MAYSKYNPKSDHHYIADTVADLADLPWHSMGDTCYVIEDGKTYTANSQKEWVAPVSESVIEGETVDMSQYVTVDMLVKYDEAITAAADHITNEALAAMPFAKIMRENGEHKIAISPSNDMLLVDKMDELGPGLYTVYMERSCQDIPEGAREIDSSCRGIFFVDTYKIAEQNSQHFYGWALLFDHDGNVYSKYVRRSVASDWKKLS